MLLLCIVVVPQETDDVKGELELKNEQYQYHPDYKNHSSKRFRELSRAFEENVSLFPSCNIFYWTHKQKPIYFILEVQSTLVIADTLGTSFSLRISESP